MKPSQNPNFCCERPFSHGEAAHCREGGFITALAAIQHKTPGFRLKAGMTKFVQFAQGVTLVIQGSIG
jgi:hypothetical protein